MSWKEEYIGEEVGMRASKKSVANAWTQLGKYFREGMKALEKEEAEKRRDGGE